MRSLNDILFPPSSLGRKWRPRKFSPVVAVGGRQGLPRTLSYEIGSRHTKPTLEVATHAPVHTWFGRVQVSRERETLVTISRKVAMRHRSVAAKEPLNLDWHDSRSATYPSRIY